LAWYPKLTTLIPLLMKVKKERHARNWMDTLNYHRCSYFRRSFNMGLEKAAAEQNGKRSNPHV